MNETEPEQIAVSILLLMTLGNIFSYFTAFHFQKFIAQADWDPALALWRAHMQNPPETPCFRASCVRDGRHCFRSLEMAGELGSEVIEKFHWKVDLENFDLEVVCILFHDQMLAGTGIICCLLFMIRRLSQKLLCDEIALCFRIFVF
jgi:hypothetical protein